MCAQPLKDGLGPAAIDRIAEAFAGVAADFDRDGFVRRAADGLERLELKDRVNRIADTLHAVLPQPFPKALAVVLKAAGDWPARDPDDPFGGFPAWPVIEFVGRHGVDHPEAALPALRRLTPLFTAEFAIRPFLVEHTDLTLAHLERWVADPDAHVRRLVSEGTRPRLPWGGVLRAFQADPAPGLRLLERLRDDPSEYVRRSVANHLNDIAKDHPDTTLEVCARWSRDAGPDRQWIVRHALRTLVKRGDRRALALLGYGDDAKVAATGMTVTPTRVVLGGAIDFALDLTSTGTAPQALLVDYAIHHRKARGGTTAKTFRLKTLELAPGATVRLAKRHPLKPITTRRYHSGTHEVEVIVNGRGVARAAFELAV